MSSQAGQGAGGLTPPHGGVTGESGAVALRGSQESIRNIQVCISILSESGQIGIKLECLQMPCRWPWNVVIGMAVASVAMLVTAPATLVTF